MVTVKFLLNGIEKEIKTDTPILEGIKANKAPYNKNCLVIVKIAEKRDLLDKRMHTEYYIETTKGLISLSLIKSPFFKDLVKTYYSFEGLKVGWLSKDVVTFGPVDMSFIDVPATHEPRDYHKWDIFLSFGGFHPSNLHLCFSKKDHSGLYGAPNEPLNGVVGRVISGGHIIPLLRKTDSILTFSPVTHTRKRVLHFNQQELETEVITPGMEIYTYLSVTFHKEAKNSVDHFFAIMNSNSITVDEASSMFLKNHKFRGAKIPPENPVFRQSGAITVRNQGNDTGSVYIYKNDTSFSISHNVLGQIASNNLPLIENANPGDKILLETIPTSFNFIGKTQKYATEYLNKHDISQKRVGDENDDAIIVEQRPMTTMDVWFEKTCVTLGLPSSQIVRIKLFYDTTPLSIKHFRKHLNMLYNPIGKLQVLENLKNLILFIPLSGVESIEAIPRESKTEFTPEGAIGVTNALRRLTGSIGIRLVENDTYGPTGETLEGTNIIGKVISGLDLIKSFDTGDMVWFMEMKRES